MKQTLKTWLLAGCVAGMALGLNSVANAQIADGTALITVGSGDGAVNSGPLDITFDPQTGLFSLPSNTFDLGGATIIAGASGKFDPVLSYSFSATNNNAFATPFAFDLAIPITPVMAGSLVNTSLGISLTDNANDGTSFTPFPVAPYLSGFAQTATGDTLDLGAPFDIGTAETGAAGGTSVFSFNSPVAPSPFGFSTLDVHLSFTLSGGGDNAGITGRVNVTPVTTPEPGTVAMLAGLGVSGSVFALRRKRRA
jgi:hypothetical protein